MDIRTATAADHPAILAILHIEQTRPDGCLFDPTPMPQTSVARFLARATAVFVGVDPATNRVIAFGWVQLLGGQPVLTAGVDTGPTQASRVAGFLRVTRHTLTWCLANSHPRLYGIVRTDAQFIRTVATAGAIGYRTERDLTLGTSDGRRITAKLYSCDCQTALQSITRRIGP